ncbi:MAG TPA: ABC transporter substrate-binding protein [Geobacteraceae bacterium]
MTKTSLVFVLLLVACLPPLYGHAADADALKVGLIAELTGTIPAVGASCRNGAELAVREINGSGGILVDGRRRRLELVVEDSGNDPDRAAAAARKLVEKEQVIAIIGPNASPNTRAAANVAERERVVLITPWSTNPLTTRDEQSGKPKRYVFRVCFTDNFEGEELGDFASKTLKAGKAAVLFDRDIPVLKGQAELFRASFERNGGRVVAFEAYSSGERDLTSHFIRIREARPELVFLPSYYSDVPHQVRQARALGITVPFLGSDAWSSPELVAMCGAACEGAFFCNHYSAESASLAVRRFVAAYKAAYGSTPDDVAALTYDAFAVLRQAFVKAGRRKREAVRNALAGISEYHGVTGSLRYQPGTGDPIKGAVIMQIKDGRFVWFADVEP